MENFINRNHYAHFGMSYMSDLYHAGHQKLREETSGLNEKLKELEKQYGDAITKNVSVHGISSSNPFDVELSGIDSSVESDIEDWLYERFLEFDKVDIINKPILIEPPRVPATPPPISGPAPLPNTPEHICQQLTQRILANWEERLLLQGNVEMARENCADFTLSSSQRAFYCGLVEAYEQRMPILLREAAVLAIEANNTTCRFNNLIEIILSTVEPLVKF